MVRAWYMPENWTGDQRLAHMTNPPQMIDMFTLREKTGVLYYQIPHVTDYLHDKILNTIKQERGYTFEDDLIINERKESPEFYKEHTHADEEIRFTVDGSAYYDIRDRGDRWIRIEVVMGDLLILPAGIYHRFTPDSNNFVKIKRFFVGEPVWTPHDREDPNTERLPARQQYATKK